MGGLGGAPGADGNDNLDNGALQLGFSLVTEPHTFLDLRIGRLRFSDDEPLESLLDADLTFVTIAGEYRFRERFYDSGLFLGLGGYRLEGTGPQGDSDETAIGITAGVVGEFPINRRFGIQAELTGHYTDLDDIDVLVTGQVGIAVHFW
jgi:hypothetical protein